jgi:hypothetical protein
MSTTIGSNATAAFGVTSAAKHRAEQHQHGQQQPGAPASALRQALPRPIRHPSGIQTLGNHKQGRDEHHDGSPKPATTPAAGTSPAT